MTEPFTGFSPALIKFLNQLKRNNNRDWFAENKSRYETEVLFPALAFVEAFQPRLKKISPYFMAVPKRVGGSVMRVYRDTRFAKDKTPYKTNLGIHFRHERGKDAHCPGFYLHIDPQECFLGAGIWHPDSASLNRIRAAIDEDRAVWKRVRDQKTFRSHFELAGDSLIRPPRGFDADHPCIEDLKRKDHIGIKSFDAKTICGPDFLDQVASTLSSSRGYMRFLCDALRVPF
jgi:uncharacterized protein (TIGR02453 family)